MSIYASGGVKEACSGVYASGECMAGHGPVVTDVTARSGLTVVLPER